MAEITLTDLLLNAGSLYPDRIALVTPSEQVTYSELLYRAKQLAAYLAETGLHPGDRVVICLPKCVELSTAIFGTLLIGGCYVPIDYITPVPRVKLIVRDAEPKAVICTVRMAQYLFENFTNAYEGDLDRRTGRQISVFILDDSVSTTNLRASSTQWSHIMDSKTLYTPVMVDPATKAYILYTSGSTGQPKGVVHTHDSALAFIQWASDHLGLESKDILSQHASPSFDLTIFDFFCSTMAAATLVSIPEWMFGQVAKTCRFIVDKGITIWYSVPSALLRQGGVEPYQDLPRSALRHVVFAGEVIPKRTLGEFVKHLPAACTVSNWYGPTETNVCTYQEITAANLISDRPIPIGLPCPYAQTYLDSETGEGELFVASPTVMDGYWKLDDLTAQVFTEGPGNRRYYKTGDIVTYDGDQLLFLGRRDRLLKIRGYRVQPEEVEQVLQKHTEVVEAVTVAIPEEEEGNRLVAVIVTNSLEDEALPDIKRYCNDMLPSYMVPSEIVCISKLPRGSRGKVDLDAVTRLISSKLPPDWNRTQT